jgi:exopolysaccharide biosynthesis polyprenyl glycosylphosphotransferase
MFQQQVVILNMTLMILDSVCIIGAGYSAYLMRSYESYWLWTLDDNVLAIAILFVMFTNNAAMSRMGLYSDRRIASYWKLAVATLKSVIIDFLALSSVIFLFHSVDFSRFFLIYFACFSFFFLLVARFAVNKYLKTARSSFNACKMLVVGDETRSRLVMEALNRQVSLGHEIVSYMAVTGNGNERCEKLDELLEILKNEKIDEVIFAVPKDAAIHLEDYLAMCSRKGIPVRILPSLWNPAEFPIRVEQCQNLPFLTMNFNRINATGQLYKRMLDLVGGAFGTLVLGIIYPFVALAIKLDSEGPVFFKQARIGQNGREFKLFKFRSMYADAEERKKKLLQENEMSGPMFKMTHDPRITRVGRFLRNTSLDEFPQFLNVLRGEMSLVGTRPPTPAEVQQYDLAQHKRISAKPGITGLWQISGRNQIRDFNEVVRLDCKYLENWRFKGDLLILFKTFWVVLARKGAM